MRKYCESCCRLHCFALCLFEAWSLKFEGIPAFWILCRKCMRKLWGFCWSFVRPLIDSRVNALSQKIVIGTVASSVGSRCNALGNQYPWINIFNCIKTSTTVAENLTVNGVLIYSALLWVICVPRRVSIFHCALDFHCSVKMHYYDLCTKLESE